jgi:hypothetical protein
MLSADWVIAISTIALAICTLALAVVAAFQDRIRAWLLMPKLKVYYTHTPPFAHRTWWRSPQDAELKEPVYYFSFQVVNEGLSQARRCEAVLEDLWICDAAGNPEKHPNFSPVNLTWVAPSPTPQFLDINPNRKVYCNIGHISSPSYQEREEKDPRRRIDIPGYDDSGLRFFLEQTKWYYSQPNCLAPGKYAIRVSLYAENAPYQEHFFEIVWSGKWQNSDPEMFREIVIRSVEHP